MNIEEFLCKDCDYLSSHKNDLELHIKTKHESTKNFVWDQCGYYTSDKRFLARHVNAIHKEVNMVNGDEIWP